MEIWRVYLGGAAVLAWVMAMGCAEGRIGDSTDGGSLFCPSLQIISTQAPQGMVLEHYEIQLEGLGGSPPLFFWLEGSIPEGLTFDPLVGLLSGEPQGLWGDNVTITVTDSCVPHQAASYTFFLDIQPLPCDPLRTADEALLPATKGQAYDFTVQVTGGEAPLGWSVSVGSLPEGMFLGDEDGRLHGAPREAGEWSFTLTVTDSCVIPQGLDIPLTLSVSDTGCEAVVIQTTSLPSGNGGEYYVFDLMAMGGVEPYTWSIKGDPLPSGLILDGETGRISGIPVQEGAFPLEIWVKDSCSPPMNAVQVSTLEILHVDCPALMIITEKMPDALAYTFYDEAITVMAGTFPYWFSLVGGSIPPGTALDYQSGDISGQPEQTGDFTFDIDVSDSCSPEPRSDSRRLSLRVGIWHNQEVIITGSQWRDVDCIPISNDTDYEITMVSLDEAGRSCIVDVWKGPERLAEGTQLFQGSEVPFDQGKLGMTLEGFTTCESASSLGVNISMRWFGL